MFGSPDREEESDPVVCGGVYEYTASDGAREQALMVSTRKDAHGVVWGNLYYFKGGPNPLRVAARTESMAQWSLVAAPTKGAARSILADWKKANDKTKVA
jgi:hypothetical protein